MYERPAAIQPGGRGSRRDRDPSSVLRAVGITAGESCRPISGRGGIDLLRGAPHPRSKPLTTRGGTSARDPGRAETIVGSSSEI